MNQLILYQEFVNKTIAFFIDKYVECVIWIAASLVRLPMLFYSYISLSSRETSQDVILERRLKNADNYHQWLAIATEIDRLRNFEQWKRKPRTKLYDYKLIFSRIQSLRTARQLKDVPTMKLLIRSGLLRNLGNICDPNLFIRSFTGTKTAIEDYLQEVILTIQAILEVGSEHPHQKLDLFQDVDQSFGHTALLMQGGGSFGLFHLGVVKALVEVDLLPRIISGSSVGALMAALVCIHTDDELPSLFRPGGIDLAAFSVKNPGGSIQRKIIRLFTEGYLLDVNVLEECIKANLQDITFEEAYLKTNRTLNIIVSSTSKNEIPIVLNHLTTPRVLIRSAACASVAVGSWFYKSVDLLAKDREGKIFVWSPSRIKWGGLARSGEREAPEQRLAELFNVNHFLLSQSQPYIAPFLDHDSPNKNGRKSSSFLSRIFRFTSSEIQFRINQLSKLGAIPDMISGLFEQKIEGNVTIAPPLSDKDFFTIFSTPTHRSLSYWVLKGEQSTWPLISMIKNRTCLERKLYQVKMKLEDMMKSLKEKDPSFENLGLMRKNRTSST